jgi:uncharacterized membrane protein YdjX (TVP38/TMEM64 family)
MRSIQDSMSQTSHFRLRFAFFVAVIVALVSVPFVVWGDAYVLPLLESHADRGVLLALLSILLLAADSVAPVPSTLVLIFLAVHAGPVIGVIAGTVGLTASVLLASWFGRSALGRIAPRFVPDAELARMRDGLERNLALTLACWRGVPVLAETSVMLAAAAGVPLARILRVTLLPNFIIAVVYSFAADDSLLTASVAFFVILFLSLATWWLFGKRKSPQVDLPASQNSLQDRSHSHKHRPDSE